MEQREAGFEPLVYIIDTEAEVKGVAGHVAVGQGVVGALVIVVIVGDVDFRALELLVEKSGLEGKGKFALQCLVLVTYLGIGREIAKQSV